MFEKDAEEYAINTRTQKEIEVLNTVQDWGGESLSPEERHLWEGISDRQVAREQGFQKGAEFGYNKANEWHYVKDKLPPIGETVLLFYGSDAMGKVVMSAGSIDCKGNWYKNVDDTPIMWQSINLPSNKNITKDYLYCDNQLLPERY